MKTTREKLEQLEAHLSDAMVLIDELAPNAFAPTQLERELLADLRRRADAGAHHARLLEQAEEAQG